MPNEQNARKAKQFTLDKEGDVRGLIQLDENQVPKVILYTRNEVLLENIGRALLRDMEELPYEERRGKKISCYASY